MREGLTKWINEWAIEENDNSFRVIEAQTRFLSKVLYHDHQPSMDKTLSFQTRLESWLQNVNDRDDRKTLVRLIPHLFYIGQKEINNLYRVAYNEIIARWLLDVDLISLENLNEAKDALQKGVRSCWFCPITDSLDINSFFHLNNIPNNGWNEWRPQWYTIDRPNNHNWISHENYISQHGIKKLVLLEDFVGSGSQVQGVVEFILSKNIDLDILLLPLINCPKGVENFLNLKRKHARLSYGAVLEPPESGFLSRLENFDEHADYNLFRNLAIRVYSLVSGGKPESGHIKPYSPFGYRDTGGLIVKYSNTPDNSLPLIHWSTSTWDPLFPRHSRN